MSSNKGHHNLAPSARQVRDGPIGWHQYELMHG